MSKRLGVLTGLGVVLGLLLLWGAVWSFRWVTARPSGALGARETILSGEFRIAAYQHFFNLCAGIQGLEASLGAQTELLKQTTDSREQNRVRANIAGITAERGRAIAQYNADARKDYTEGQFRDLDLPYLLDPKGWTSCGTR